jgi:hypothetical protein
MGRPEAKVFADNFSLYTLDAPELVYRSFRVNDSGGVVNAKLDPGEEAALTLVLGNAGSSVPMTTARLVSLSPFLEVLDADGTLGAAGAGESTESEVDAFRVRAAGDAPVEVPAMCQLIVTGTGYDDTVPVPVLIGDSMNLPQGPDAGGYRIFDYTDSCYADRPDYEWVELRGVGTNLHIGNDETRVLPLPTAYGHWRWYGQDYDSISICSNGWIAAGATDRPDFVPIILPYENSPANMLAVYWADYDPATYGAVWYWHDTTNHRFIVEWDSVPYVGHTADWERFQVQVYDQTVITPTGDNTATMMYDVINYPDFNTAGFQNQVGSVGLTHTWKGWYPRVAAPLRPHAALRVLTGTPAGVVHDVGSPARPYVSSPAISPSLARVGDDIDVKVAAGEGSELRIIDASGSIVGRWRVGPGQTRFRRSTRGWASGVYYVHAGSRVCVKFLLLP